MKDKRKERKEREGKGKGKDSKGRLMKGERGEEKKGKGQCKRKGENVLRLHVVILGGRENMTRQPLYMSLFSQRARVCVRERVCVYLC